jgi:hypothetical protein
MTGCNIADTARQKPADSLKDACQFTEYKRKEAGGMPASSAGM